MEIGASSSCFYPMRTEEAFLNIAKLGFSEGYTPVICIGMGYPDEAPEAKPRDFGKVKFVD